MLRESVAMHADYASRHMVKLFITFDAVVHEAPACSRQYTRRIKKGNENSCQGRKNAEATGRSPLRVCFLSFQCTCTNRSIADAQGTIDKVGFSKKKNKYIYTGCLFLDDRQLGGFRKVSGIYL